MQDLTPRYMTPRYKTESVFDDDEGFRGGYTIEVRSADGSIDRLTEPRADVED